LRVLGPSDLCLGFSKRLQDNCCFIEFQVIAVDAENYSLLWGVTSLNWHTFLEVSKKKPSASVLWVGDQ